MNSFGRFVPALLAAVAAVGIGCSDSSGPGARAASVTGVAGDSQAAPSGAPLAFPLSLVTLDAGGQPLQGVRVSWSVTPAGEAIFNPTTSISDANGQASTTVTVGRDSGRITIQASVSGVTTPVVYHAVILNPCTYTTPYTLGQTVAGALTTLDCNFGQRGWYYDFYALDLPVGQQSIRIGMQSTAFDTYVDFFRADGPFVAFDDDIVLGVTQNSQLDIILPGDNYVIGANSYNQLTTGAYTISTAARPAALNGCRQVWVTRGVTATDSITASDCADSSATPHHYDVARIFVRDTSVLTISAQSATINPTLALYQLDPNSYARTLVKANDDSAVGTTTAFIQDSVAGPKFFDILISTSSTTETGPYTFTVSSSTTMSPPVMAVRATRPVFSGPAFWRAAAATLLQKRAKH